jgi:hypothetical protein
VRSEEFASDTPSALRREFTAVLAFASIVSTDQYKELAESEAEDSWVHVCLGAMRARLLQLLTPEAVENVLNAVRKRHQKADGQRTVVRNGTVCSIQFSRQQFNEYVRELDQWRRGTDRRASVARDALVSTLTETEGDGLRGDEVLFVGLLLGVLWRWQEARELILAALPRLEGNAAAEANYLLAVSTKRVAIKTGDSRIITEALDCLKRATDMKRVLRNDPTYEDPRFEYETACCLGWQLEHAGFTAVSADDGYAGILDHLGRALRRARDDAVLKVAIHNVMAYTLISGPVPDLTGAQRSVEAIEAEFRRARSSSEGWLPEQPWTAVKDTMLYVAAVVARHLKDVAGLERVQNELAQLRSGDPMDESERRVVDAHLARIAEWLRELGASHD